jgi:hypothetical protein
MMTAELLSEVEHVFPFVEKPQELDLSFHKDECYHCEFLRRDLVNFTGQELPRDALRVVFNEMSCLSAAGSRWVLPSYLRHCLAVADTYDDSETEYLIYNLGPAPEHQCETRERLAALNDEQITCLIHFLEWCGVHPYWSAYCQEDISRALAFMRVGRIADQGDSRPTT